MRAVVAGTTCLSPRTARSSRRARVARPTDRPIAARISAAAPTHHDPSCSTVYTSPRVRGCSIRLRTIRAEARAGRQRCARGRDIGQGLVGVCGVVFVHGGAPLTHAVMQSAARACETPAGALCRDCDFLRCGIDVGPRRARSTQRRRAGFVVASYQGTAARQRQAVLCDRSPRASSAPSISSRSTSVPPRPSPVFGKQGEMREAAGSPCAVVHHGVALDGRIALEVRGRACAGAGASTASCGDVMTEPRRRRGGRPHARRRASCCTTPGP